MIEAILPSSISELGAKSPCSASVFGFRVIWMLRIQITESRMLRIQITESRMLGAKRPERSGFASIWMLRIQITESRMLRIYLDASHPNNREQGRKASKVHTWALRARLLGYFVAKPRNRERSSRVPRYFVTKPRNNAEPSLIHRIVNDSIILRLALVTLRLVLGYPNRCEASGSRLFGCEASK